MKGLGLKGLHMGTPSGVGIDENIVLRSARALLRGRKRKISKQMEKENCLQPN